MNLGLTPLEGGWSGETFVSGVGDQRVVIRIYAAPGDRGEHAQHIDAALLRLVSGLIPVPRVLEARRPVDDAPGLLVTSFEPGERGDLLVARLIETDDLDGLARVGRSLGGVLADLGGMPHLEAGTFVDDTLRVAPFPAASDLADWVDLHEAPLVERGWGTDDLTSLRALADRAQDLLDTVPRRCLVHGDFNPKNLLIDPETLAVGAVLDWEFAHAGHPFTDLGNLLRFDQHPAFVDGVLTAYGSRRGDGLGHADLAALGRAADLLALVDLAARAGDNPVADRAAGLLRQRVVSG